jgi:2'-5' RNA ligase
MTSRKDPESIRTFICIEIPESIKERITTLQTELRRLAAQVSWVRPANIHLTLKFLGDVSADKTPQIIEAVRRASGSCSPFQVEVSGTGCFPSRRRPSVLWVGLKAVPEPLSRLQKALEDELARQGFPRETKAFKPHLTIGRLRSPRDAEQLADALIERGFAGESFSANGVIVMKSLLDPRGAIYTPLAALPLAP